jgi:uncharacterized protein (TIGR02145 family)
MKTKNRICISPLIIITGLLLLNAISCKKENEQMQGQPPVLSTRHVYPITSTTANCGGDITNDGGAKVTARGVCWSKTPNPTTADNKTVDDTGTGTFKSEITGLTATTSYYVRAYATNSVATGYGNELSFKTYTGTISDVEGNVYNIMRIGTQTWMVENLKTTRFNDNTAIPLVSDNAEWEELSTPGYCWYNNIPSLYKLNFGALYNFFVIDNARNGGKNLCPTGWHVPTNAEWTTIATFLGGDSIAGGKMKETITLWLSPNTGATNESGFTALPGGGRYYNGIFDGTGSNGCWWSSTELLTSSARGRFLYYDYRLIYSGSGSKRDGFSVRCLKD